MEKKGRWALKNCYCFQHYLVFADFRTGCAKNRKKGSEALEFNERSLDSSSQKIWVLPGVDHWMAVDRGNVLNLNPFGELFMQ